MDRGRGDNLWTTGANWTSGAPLPGDDLFFSGVTRQSNINDFPAATAFNSIEFANAGFTLNGNSIMLSAALGDTGNNTISFDISTPAGITMDVTSGLLNIKWNGQRPRGNNDHSWTWDWVD